MKPSNRKKSRRADRHILLELDRPRSPYLTAADPSSRVGGIDALWMSSRYCSEPPLALNRGRGTRTLVR